MGSWSTGCDDNGNNCTYKASWMVLGEISSVFFVVEARTTGWVGIGFSENNLMVMQFLTYSYSILCSMHKLSYHSIAVVICHYPLM